MITTQLRKFNGKNEYNSRDVCYSIKKRKILQLPLGVMIETNMFYPESQIGIQVMQVLSILAKLNVDMWNEN